KSTPGMTPMMFSVLRSPFSVLRSPFSVLRSEITPTSRRPGQRPDINLRPILPSAAVLLVALTSPVLCHAEPAPAVSALNGKLEVLGGQVDSGDSHALAGSLTLPVGRRYGLQFDAMAGKVNDRSAKGAGLHGFWRDPGLGMVGITALAAESASTGLYRSGLEGERYWDDITVAATAGLQGGDVDDAAYANLDLRWYPSENLMLEAGALHVDSTNGLRLGAEFQPFKARGLSVFVDAGAGDQGFDYVLAGVRWYFGASKPLKRRHREDDPVNIVTTGLSQSTPAIADHERRVAESLIPVDGTACVDGNGDAGTFSAGQCVATPPPPIVDRPRNVRS
ncbi:MAG: hypothetical protein ACPGU7_15275, partial [Gammaproteobacteria bacterium]